MAQNSKGREVSWTNLNHNQSLIRTFQTLHLRNLTLLHPWEVQEEQGTKEDISRPDFVREQKCQFLFLLH